MAEIKTVKKTARLASSEQTKTAAKTVEKKVATRKITVKAGKKAVVLKSDVMEKETGLSLSIYDIAGKAAGKVALPKEIFDAKVNKQLIAQAVRVYLVNQRQGTVATRTRGEVTGSTRKIYRQKGTGRARHGGIRAPIFVKGGLAHGPKPKDYQLHMSKSMRKAALYAALTAKLQDGAIKVVSGFEAIAPKTKIAAGILKNLGLDKKNLFVLPGKMENVEKAARNLASVTVTSVDRLNTYEVMGHKTIILFKDSVKKMEEQFLKKAK